MTKGNKSKRIGTADESYVLREFWVKVLRCKHKNLRTTGLVSRCSTPYCGSIREDRCLDCGAFLTSCACGANNETSVWSEAHRSAEKHRKSKV